MTGREKLEQAVLCAGLGLGFLGLAAWLRERRKKEVVPLDLRLKKTQKRHKKIKFGFMGAGRVAHDFANALKTVDDAELYCVAVSSGLERSQKFARAHGFTKAYASYEEALKDPEVDIIYLSTMHSSRAEHVPEILKAGKHALVEKPIALSVKEAESFFDLAKSKHLFLMEGMWTRFFPAVEEARRLMDQGSIGEVTAVLSDFGFDAGDSGAYPKDPSKTTDGDPIYHASLGGGALLWAGPYPIAAGLLPFKGEAPNRILASGVSDPLTKIELSCAIALDFHSPGGFSTSGQDKRSGCPARGACASLFTAIDSESTESSTYIGQLGRIVVESPGHCPTNLSLHLKAKGRGSVSSSSFYFPLPKVPRDAAKIKDGSDYFYYPNSMGFAYEAAAVARCIAAGLTECPQYTSQECLNTMNIISHSRDLVLASSSS